MKGNIQRLEEELAEIRAEYATIKRHEEYLEEMEDRFFLADDPEEKKTCFDSIVGSERSLQYSTQALMNTAGRIRRILNQIESEAQMYFDVMEKGKHNARKT